MRDVCDTAQAVEGYAKVFDGGVLDEEVCAEEAKGVAPYRGFSSVGMGVSEYGGKGGGGGTLRLLWCIFGAGLGRL